MEKNIRKSNENKKIDNKNFKLAMNVFMKERTRDIERIFTKELFLSIFLVPVEKIKTNVKGTVMGFKILVDSKGDSYYMAFTDEQEANKWSDEHKDLMFMTYGDLMGCVIKDDGKSAGAVINPYGENLPVTTHFLQYLNLDKNE